MLNDIKVLDLSTLLPGPYASMMLADLGAEVLRLESPDRVDLVREMEPQVGSSSAAHQTLNRSKRAIALDLKQPEAVEIVHRLVKEYDIVLEQFRPGVMDRLGLGYENLKKINPRIIYCSITGFGQTGPFKHRAGHDLNYLALSGLSSYSRRAKQPPVPLGMQVADVAGGSLHSVIVILAALHHRDKTGEGQMIDISMTDAVFAMNAMSGAGALADKTAPEAEAHLLNGGSFYDYYETRDGRYFSVGSLEPKFFQGLCDLLGKPELKALEKDPELKEHLTSIFKSKTFSQWQEIFSEADLCVEPVLNFLEACEHPQLQARDMLVDVPMADGQVQQQRGNPIKFSTCNTHYSRTGGSVGADGKDVLEELGLDEKTIDKLIKKNIVRI